MHHYKSGWFYGVFFIVLCICKQGISQTTDHLTYNNIPYTIFILPADSVSASNIGLVQNKAGFTHGEFVQEYINHYDSSLFAINACINQKTGYPLGMFVLKNKVITQLNTGDGSGNFYIKPNGLFYTKNGDVDIIESGDADPSGNYTYAVQSGPMLLINSQINTNFDPNSVNKNTRCGVGVYHNNTRKDLVFAISEAPVTFYDFAAFLQATFQCERALCLESSGCGMYTPNSKSNPASDNYRISNYIVYCSHPDMDFASKNLHQPVTIQMAKDAGGTYEIPVILNGVVKRTFIFDSGASDVSISPEAAKELFQSGTVSGSDFIGSAQYVFADGSRAVSHVFILHEVKIGNRIIKNVRASIAATSGAPMLLGESVLQKIGKYTIDNTRHTITIE